jgi:F-type H+-transporting ATPase subunit delta
VINTTLAKRYARALVEIGQQQNALEKFGADLTALCDLVEASKDFREVLISPVFTRDDKRRIAGDILSKLGTDLTVTNFIYLLIDRKRIDQLAGIEAAFRQAVDDINGIKRGEVVSADSLDEGRLAQITDSLSKISGKHVLVTTKIDPELIGGVMAKVGDMVFDGTIRTQLNQLKESLKG